MAQNWAKPFYNSKAWIDLSHRIRTERFYRCQRCGQYANTVHHRIHLTQQNINDSAISLNPNNLELLCHDCHDKEHDRFKKSSDPLRRKIVFDSNGNPIKVIEPNKR